MRRVALLFMLAFGLSACGDSAGSSPADDAASGDAAVVDVLFEDLQGADDVVVDVGGEDALALDTAPEDVAPVCPGGAGCPCAGNDECDGGLCLEGAEGKRCAKPCVDSCAAGYVCAQVSQGSDVVTVCVDAWARLCSPCSKSEQCNHPGVTDARCVNRGDAGAFWARRAKAMAIAQQTTPAKTPKTSTTTRRASACPSMRAVSWRRVFVRQMHCRWR